MGDDGIVHPSFRLERQMPCADDWQPHTYGGPEDADAHGDGQHDKRRHHGEAVRCARMGLRSQIELENGKRNNGICERQKRERRTPERLKVETNRAVIEEKPQKEPYPVKPGSTDARPATAGCARSRHVHQCWREKFLTEQWPRISATIQ